MGVIYGSDANGNVCIDFAESQTEATGIITAQTATGRPADIIAMYTGASFDADLDIPVGRELSEYRVNSGALQLLVDIPNLDNLKRDARNFHEFLNGLSLALEGDEARLWSSNVVGFAHNWIRELHYGANVVVARRVTSVAALTIQQRMTWCRQNLLGPSNVRALNPLTQRKEIIHTIYEVVSATTAPSVPVTYINPLTGTPIDLRDAVSMAGDAAYTNRDGNTGVLLDLQDATDFTGNHAIDIDGSWIDNISA